MITRIPSVPTVPTSFAHTAQSGPIGSSAFVQGFPWNGGHIPPSTPYVGPTPAYVGVQFENPNPYGQGFQTPVSTHFMSSPFSLLSRGIPTTIFQTLASTGAARTSYTASHINNPLAYGWNPFQSSPTTSQLAAGGNPTFTFGNVGESPSNPQTGTFSTPIRPKIPFLEMLNLPYFSKLMNDLVRHDPSLSPVPTKFLLDIPKFKGKVGEDPRAHATTFFIYGALPTH